MFASPGRFKRSEKTLTEKLTPKLLISMVRLMTAIYTDIISL